MRTLNIFFIFAMASQTLFAGNSSCANTYALKVAALFWQADEEGLDVAFVNNQGTGAITNGTLHQLPPNWDAGFRIGLGAALPCYCIETGLTWTHFSSNTRWHESAPDGGALQSVWTTPSASLTSPTEGEGKWDLCLDIALLEVGRPFYLLPCVDISPTIGLIFAVVNQSIDLNFSGGVAKGSSANVLDDKIRMKNNYFGVGLRAGLESLWKWSECLGLYAKGGCSLLNGSFDIRQSESVLFDVSETPSDILGIKDTPYRTRILAEYKIGVRWETAFKRYGCFIFDLGWEQLYFFGQNQLKRFTTSEAPGIQIPTNGDLSLKGVTLTGTYLF